MSNKFFCFFVIALLIAFVGAQTVNTTVSVTVSPTLSPTYYPPSVTPAPSPSPTTVPASNDTESLVVRVTCDVTTTECCDFFPNVWASFVNVNDPTLISVTSCSANNQELIVKFDQSGTNFHSVDEIINNYWNLAGCQQADPLTDGYCVPTTNNLNSILWSAVNVIQVDNQYYVLYTITKSQTPSQTPYPSRTPSVSPTSDYYIVYNGMDSSFSSIFFAFVLLSVAMLL